MAPNPHGNLFLLTVFHLSVRYVSCGASFQLAANILSCTYDVLHNPVLRCCSRYDVANFIRVICAVNLQRIADHLRSSWAFSIALDSATHQSTSYLDMRFRIFVPAYFDIANLHAAVLPMFDRHTGEVMFKMVEAFLNVLCPEWKVHLLGVSSDGGPQYDWPCCWYCHSPQQRDAQRVSADSNLVWSAPIEPRYGTHHG